MTICELNGPHAKRLEAFNCIPLMCPVHELYCRPMLDRLPEGMLAQGLGFDGMVGLGVTQEACMHSMQS